jgi:hypothetical protein
VKPLGQSLRSNLTAGGTSAMAASSSRAAIVTARRRHISVTVCYPQQ